MAKYKFNSPVSHRKRAIDKRYRIAEIQLSKIKGLQAEQLPKLSIDTYSFTKRAVVKKKKSIQHNLQCAEDLIMQEMGCMPLKKKERTRSYISLLARGK